MPGWPNGSGGSLQSCSIWVQLPSPAPTLKTYTLVYTHLVNFSSEEFVCKVAKTVEEVSKLIESGFDYVTEVDSVKLFKKENELSVLLVGWHALSL